MDRRELNRMFDGLAPGPGRERELLDGLLQDGGRGKAPIKNWKRIAVGLAAAVLLAGTAAAAHYAGVGMVEKDDGFVYFAGGIGYYAADQLSDEVKEFEAAYSGDCRPMKTFASWEEMEDFLGVDLMNNPLLDASPAQTYYQSVDNGEQRVSGCYILEVYRGLAMFLARGCYEIGGAFVNVDAYLYTDKWEGDIDPGREFLGLGNFPEGTEVSRESWAAPGGRQVQVLEIDRANNLWDTCVGALSLNGIPVLVEVHSHEGVAEAREVLMQVLDSFQ